MAVDEWLLGHAMESGTPILRVYRWLGHWVSFGYALGEPEARRHFPDPDLRFARRWTGGGVVDHRRDWTYTLVIPAAEPLAALPAPQRYQRIHAALAAALRAEALEVRLSDGAAATASDACFHNPVAYDLVDPAGRKIAGAGQRRTRTGVLHQGSVEIPPAPGAEDPPARAGRFAAQLAKQVVVRELQPAPDALESLQQIRYRNPSWRVRPPAAGDGCRDQSDPCAAD